MTFLRSIVLTALVLLSGSLPAYALEEFKSFTLQSAAGATGNGTAVETASYTSIALQVTISATATVTFEGTQDGSTWASAVCTSTANTSGTLVTSATATGLYQCSVAGLSQFRVRVSSFGSGTVTVTGRVTTAVMGKKGGGGSSLTVAENDGSPSVASVNTINFTNGTVADSGGGVVAVTISGTGAPTDSPYITSVPVAGLSAEVALSALSTGCMASATTTGVVATRTLTGTANQITVTNGDCSGTPTFSIPSSPTLPGTTTGTFSGNLTGNVTGTASIAATGDSATSFWSTGTIEDARLPSSMADKVITGSLNIPNGTAPTTDAAGEIAFDTNIWGSSRGSVQIFDGTALTHAVNVLASDTPANGECPKWNTGGTITWETCAGGSGDVTAASNFGTDNVVIRSDSTSKGVQSTGIFVDDSNNVTGAASVGFGADAADAGRVRLSNTDSICWEAATPGTDLCLTLNSSNEFELSAPLNLTGTAGPLLLTGVSSPSAPSGSEQWYLYAASADNLPKYIYNGGSEVTFYTTANPQTTITGNAGTASALAANGSNCSAGSAPLGVSAAGAAESCTDFLEAGDNIGGATATTPSANDNDTSVATTAFVITELTAYASDPVTMTNKTLDCEGTGNLCTIPRRLWFPAAGVNNVTAGTIWDLPASNPAVPSYRTGTNQTKGFLDFADGASLSASQTFMFPGTFSGSVDARVYWQSSVATTGDVVWQIAIACASDGDSDDPAFTYDVFTADTAKGTINLLNITASNSVSTTGTCSADDIAHISIKRDSAHGSDTMAGTARLIGVELIIREAI